MRRIVFFGNCQAGALRMIYASRIAHKYGDEALWLRSWVPLTDADERALRNCDLIIEQVSAQPFQIDISSYRHHPGLKQFPSIYLSFIWPYGNQAHPRNQPIPLRDQGPYEMNDGDAYLNGKLARNIDMDAALAEYFQGNPFGSPERLDRYYELYMGQQRAMDERTDFSFAGDMEARFRTEQLFATFSHPTLSFARHYIASVLERLVCSRADASDAVNALARSPFDSSELPVHPVIAKHFSLQWAGASRRYVTFTGELLDHREYFTRYAGYEWNRPLADLLYAARQAEPAGAEQLIDALAACLLNSHDSSLGYAVLGDLNLGCSRLDAAKAAFARAIEIDGNQSDLFQRLAQCHIASGGWLDAEAAITAALRLSPTNPESLHLYSEILARCDRLDEAVSASKRAVAFAPRHLPYLQRLVGLHQRNGQANEAAALLEAAITRDPGLHELSYSLARLFEHQLEFEKAADICRATLTTAPADREASRILANVLIRQGHHEAAETVLREIISHSLSEDAELLHLLSRSLHSQAKSAEALSHAARSVEIAPDHPYYLRHLADLRDVFGERESSIACLERAVMLAPDDENIRHALSRAKGAN